jgi:hypothetical protein
MIRVKCQAGKLQVLISPVEISKKQWKISWNNLVRALWNSQRSITSKWISNQENPHLMWQEISQCLYTLLSHHVVFIHPCFTVIILWRRQPHNFKFPLCNQREKSSFFCSIVTCLTSILRIWPSQISSRKNHWPSLKIAWTL